MCKNLNICSLLLILILSNSIYPQASKFEEISRFHAREARQGVAVDSNYIYAIGSQQIAKYDKKTHSLVKKWKGNETGPIIHLDSGVILDGKLYCAHSNYPDVPMTSSIEIWNAETLEHIGNHSFGINWGSCTWVDRKDGFWYAGFAQYNKWKHLTGKGSEWTVVNKFDDNWRLLESWTYPKEVVERFEKMSNSGGSFGPGGYLYLTGHDATEIYVMNFPQFGSELVLVEILKIANEGQGLAWDRTQTNVLYGIVKEGRWITVSELVKE